MIQSASDRHPGSPVNVTQLAILRCIDRSKRQPLTHVAQELEMDRSSLYRALNPMIRDQWVKIADGTDARSLTAVITHKGTESLKRRENCFGPGKPVISQTVHHLQNWLAS